MSSTITVVIPTYNRRDLVVRAVRSAIGQTIAPSEVLVVDDGSTDETAEAVESLRLANVRYVRRTANGGGAAARNTGLAEARSEYVAFLDSDDEWDEQKLERQLALFEEDAAAGTLGLVTCGSRVVLDGVAALNHSGVFSGDPYEHLMLLETGCTTSSFMVHRERILGAGIHFDPTLTAFEDRDFLMQIARQFRVATVCETLVTQYRNHGGDHLWNNDNARSSLVRLIEKYRSELERRPVALMRHYKRLASLCHASGDISGMRHALLNAWLARPFDAKTAVWLLAAMSGPLGPRFLSTLKSGLA